jgi:hypothetical protein
MDAIDLAALDQLQPVNLDPLLWSANLSALRAQQPELAHQLECLTLPSHWRPAVALDGFPTYRIESPSAAPQWLAGTAAPRTRAGALFRHDQIADRNPALPTIAAGAELQLLLDRLSAQQAVFVFEESVLQLAAVLRIVDLTSALAEGRCILIPPEREQAFLEEHLDRYPGLLPPGMILTPACVSTERLARVRSICETVARRISDARGQRLLAVTARTSAQTPNRGDGRDARPDHAPRIAVLAVGPNPRSHQLSGELTAAADGLCWPTCCCAARGPRNVHVLPHCEKLADFAADLSICIDHPPERLPIPAGRISCQWHLDTKNVPESLPDDNTIHLAATPRVTKALRAAGVPQSRLADFHWAFPSVELEERAAPRSPRTVVIVADLPDASAAACRITQPTHRQLWAQLHQTAGKAWETAAITQPAGLLSSAERASGVTLGESSLRARMVRIIEFVLIPAVVLERISRLLLKASFGVATVGTGWHRCSSEALRPLAENLDGGPARVARAAVAAAVFGGSADPLSPALFQAAALGWPLLIHSPGGASLSPQLGGILHPQQHYDPFAGARDLRTLLDAVQADPERIARRCSRVRAHLREHHGYAQRLTALVRRLGLRCPQAITR